MNDKYWAQADEAASRAFFHKAGTDPEEHLKRTYQSILAQNITLAQGYVLIEDFVEITKSLITAVDVQLPDATKERILNEASELLNRARKHLEPVNK